MLWFTAVSQLACCHRNWAPQTCASIERFLPLVSRTKKKKIEDFLRSVFPLWSSPLSFKLLLVKYIVKGVFKVPIFLLRLCARAQQFFVLLITGGCNFRVSVCVSSWARSWSRAWRRRWPRSILRTATIRSPRLWTSCSRRCVSGQ